MDEEFRRERVKGDAARLELAALGLECMLFEGDRVEESMELGFSALEDVDLPRKRCDLAIDVLGSWTGHQ